MNDFNGLNFGNLDFGYVIYLLSYPNKQDELDFNPEYISVKELRNLYNSCYSACKQNSGLITVDYAIELYLKYIHIDKDSEIAAHVNSFVNGVFENGKQQINNIGLNTIECKLKKYIYFNYITSKISENINYLQTKLKFEYETMSDEELRQTALNMFDVNKGEFKLPTNNNTIFFDDLFDPRLLVQNDDVILPTGFAEFDKYLKGGFHKKTVCGFVTGTGGGKSTLLFSLCGNALKLGYNVAYVNLEMNNNEVNNNILSSLCGNNITLDDIRFKINNSKFIDNLKKEINHNKKGQHVIICDPALVDENDNANIYKKCDVKWLETELKKIEAIKGNFKFDLILIDYLFLMKASGSFGKNDRPDQVLQLLTQEVHKMAQRNNWAVATVFQTNRSGDREQKEGKQIGIDAIGDSYGSLRDIEFTFTMHSLKNRSGKGFSCIKSRFYNGIFEEFTLRYDPLHNIYVNGEADLAKDEIGWKKVASNKFIYENLRLTDIVNLLTIHKLKGANKGNLSNYYKAKGIKLPNKSKICFEDINIDNILGINKPIIGIDPDNLF